jgi:hypothetical protein
MSSFEASGRKNKKAQAMTHAWAGFQEKPYAKRLRVVSESTHKANLRSLDAVEPAHSYSFLDSDIYRASLRGALDSTQPASVP